MANRASMGVTCLVSLFYFIDFVQTFNVDTAKPYIYNHNAKGSYFGYSVAFNRDSSNVIIGAPLSTDTNEGKQNWGSVFTCGYGNTPEKRDCKKLPNVDKLKFGREDKSNQMMGSTVYSDNYRTMVCAPRYKTKSNDGRNFKWLHGKCDVIYPERNQDENWTWRPCVSLTSRLQEFGYCETGFSAKMNSQESDVGMISGMPRAQLSKGLLGIYNDGLGTRYSSDENKLNISDYLGYSVGSGRLLTGNPSQAFVGGAPRANLLTGAVILYADTTSGFPIKYTITDPANKPGSYFGAALAVTNIDNDEKNLDDLVVGAPFYSSGLTPNQGAVYVYLNSGGRDGVTLRQKIYGDGKGACFGYSIGSVGDLNKDANNDIAVGAPWGGKDGKGVVYIYYGAPSQHQPLIFKQKLMPSNLGPASGSLDGFGYSIAEYYPYKSQGVRPGTTLNDVDNNKYPDLAIGAYRSDSVVVLRSRPVITIIGTMNFGTTTKIDLYDTSPQTMCKAPDGKNYKCMDVKIMFMLTGVGIESSGANVQYTLDIDSDQKVAKRGFLLQKAGDVKKSVFTDVITVKDIPEYRTLKVYLINNTKDIVREMMVMLKWDIDQSVSCADEICPIANQMVNVLTMKKLPYILGCSDDGNDVCNTDLKIKMTKSLPSGSDKIQSGITPFINIHVNIDNMRENAYLNKLRIVYPTGFQPDKVEIENYPGVEVWDPNASLDENDKNTLEVTLSNPIPSKGVEKVNVQFGVYSLMNTMSKGRVTFKAEVVTDSIEEKPLDNKAEISIDVVLVANLTVTGNVYPEQLKWKKDVTSIGVRGQEIRHTFLLQNRGPSAVDLSQVLIKFPEKVDGRYILNIVSGVLEGSSKLAHVPGECIFGPFNPVGLNTTKKNTTSLSRSRREVYQGLKCGDKDIECRQITCNLKNLKKSDYVSVKIVSTLVDATFESFIKVNRKIGVYAKYTSNTVDKPAKDAATDNVEVFFTVLTPHITYTAESKPLAWWIILICVLAALLIIVIVCFILYKKKFFERNRPPTDEEAELRNGDIDEDEE